MLKALGRGPVGEGGELASSPPSTKIEITFLSLNIFCSNFEGVQIYGKDVDFRALFVKLEIWAVGGPIFGPWRSKPVHFLTKTKSETV